MDIQVASNFERALFEASGRDADWTARRDGDFARDRKLVIAARRCWPQLRARYSAFASDDAETLATIEASHAETGRIIDPHTAVGVARRAADAAERTTPVVILSTAHPAKFPDAVTRGHRRAAAVPDALAGSMSCRKG